LTTWRTIRSRIDDLINLEERRERGEFELLKKREALGLTRKIEKLNHRLGGIKDMQKLPDLIFIVDVRRENTAVREANILNIPIIALVDTNCDPDVIDYLIPSNDDAIRAIKLMSTVLADAVLEGIAMRKAAPGLEEEMAEVYLDEDEMYLGEATLAKLRAGELEFAEEAKPEPMETSAPADESESTTPDTEEMTAVAETAEDPETDQQDTETETE
jgi:small subunit ribosomal protein S2